MTQNNTLVAYSQEISPIIREIAKKKELLKDIAGSDEGAQELAQEAADVQEAYKSYLETIDGYSEVATELKELEKDLKEAISGAAKASDFKAAELKAFYLARNKEQAVKKTIDKGVLFEELNTILDGIKAQ